jgi:hypothetical protein
MAHPPAPLRVTPPLLREGWRTLWPGEAGSTGALACPSLPGVILFERPNHGGW